MSPHFWQRHRANIFMTDQPVDFPWVSRDLVLNHIGEALQLNVVPSALLTFVPAYLSNYGDANFAQRRATACMTWGEARRRALSRFQHLWNLHPSRRVFISMMMWAATPIEVNFNMII